MLIEKYPLCSTQELKALLPCKTESSIKSKAKNMGLRKAKQRFRFSADQIEEVRKIYATTLNQEIADKYGCSIHSVHNLAFRLGLKKDKEFHRQVSKKNMEDPNHPARKYWKQKGCTPANKGKKWDEYMSAEAQARARLNCFKKGNRPKQYEPVGTIKEVRKDGYLKKKIADPNKWELLHRLVWEKHNGPIPKGHNIQFRDGNRKNCTIENLYMISRDKQMIDNSGAINLSDIVVANYIAGGRGKNKHLVPDILANPKLIELKRNQLLLNREIKSQHGTSKTKNQPDDRQHLPVRK